MPNTVLCNQSKMNHFFLKLHSDDNVLIAVIPVEIGQVINFDGKDHVAKTAIPKYFKIAAREIHAGEKILKYGMSIGIATKPIAAGEMVHTQNMKSDYMRSFTEIN